MDVVSANQQMSAHQAPRTAIGSQKTKGQHIYVNKLTRCHEEQVMAAAEGARGHDY